MTLSRALGAPLALSLLALLAGGCGDDDGGGALTKAELVKQADVICADAEKAIDKIGSPESAAQLKEFAGKAADEAQKQVDKLKQLEPPAELRADWDEAMALLTQQVALARSLGENADDQAKLQEIVKEGEGLSNKSDAIAKKIGLQECGG